MHGMETSAIENVCRAFMDAYPGILPWKWDGRFEVVLAEFAVGNQEAVHNALESSLGKSWDSDSIGNAPEGVTGVSNSLGGLMRGQRLFTSDPDAQPFVFCAWWPWGDGNTISIRIGPACGQMSPSERAGFVTCVRECFGV